MPIAVDIDVMPAKRKMSVGELAERVGITPAKLAVLKNGRADAVRFTTLAELCEVLECRPGDLLRWEPESDPHPSPNGLLRSYRKSSRRPIAYPISRLHLPGQRIHNFPDSVNWYVVKRFTGPSPAEPRSMNFGPRHRPAAGRAGGLQPTEQGVHSHGERWAPPARTPSPPPLA
ncbi:helix-turn-helix domain-containing protein [Spongiactinospora gelatinilytica]|uniref:helix-turn-helix domain-containing protein n=1 Tax=Spongiactinospora gelatinilytica TaxID=2666298 RepID=UPI003F67C5AC